MANMTDGRSRRGVDPLAYASDDASADNGLDAIIAQALADRGGDRPRSPDDGNPIIDNEASTLESSSLAAMASARDSVLEPAAAAVTAPAPTLEPALQPIEPPTRWTADEKARFAAWPRDVQEAVIERNRAIEADYTRKTQEAARLRRSAEPILNAVKPFEEYLRQIAPAIGQSPDQMIGSLLGVEYQLRTGDPHQKAMALQQIAASYGIDLAALSRGELPAAPDPHYQQLRQSFGNLEQQFTQLTRWIDSEQQRQAAAELEAFVTATDPAGRPRHPHFERVRGVMAHLLRDDPALTLPAAYQQAIEPIQQAVAETLLVRDEQADRQRRDAVAKARKAAPVKSSGTPPRGMTSAGDLDSLLWDNINARMA